MIRAESDRRPKRQRGLLRAAPASVALLGLGLVGCRPGRTAPLAGVVPPTGRVDSFRVAMPELGGRERTVRVYLPPGYHTTATRFPVLYLQDGQQLFSPGALGDWRVDETLDQLVGADGFGGVIVVGVDHGERRWDEYGPWANRHMHRWIDPSWARPVEGGEGEAYLRFLAGTLKPAIDRRYRTLPGREHTGIGGSSMGGLIALYAGLTRPDVFSRVMAMSPAIWFAESDGAWLSANRLLAAIGSGAEPRAVRFYVDVGTAERSRDADPGVRDAGGAPLTYPRAYEEGSRAVVSALQARGVPASSLLFVVDPGGVHHESAWARRFAGAVRWLYR